MIQVVCSHCGSKFRVKDDLAGRSGPCPTCKKLLPVPRACPDDRDIPTGKIEGIPSRLRQTGLDVNVTLDSPSGSNGQQPLVAALLSGHARHGGRYTIESEIARGGMGAVVRALDCDIRREVAIKYMLDESDTGKKARFIEEAQITGQLEHPNIVPIHELGVDAERRIFFAMKMVRGRSLAQILKELHEHPDMADKTWSLGRLLNILVGVCHALAYAHSRSVIHRDLKPANIMVGDFGEVYVMDWGLAKVLDSPEADEQPAADPVPAPAPPAVPSSTSSSSTDDSHGATSAGSTRVVTSRDADSELTADGAIMGTPAYMSPEQAGGKRLDARSDIYSLGAILYELLTLQAPIVKDGGHFAVLLRVATGQIERPEKRAPERARQGKVPRELAAVAMKALALHATDRYPAVEDLRRDIERFQEGRSVSAKHDSTWESLVKFVKRNKAFSAATAVASVVLAMVVTVSLAVNYRARLRAENAQGRAEEAQGRAETAKHKAEEHYAQYVHEQQARREQAKTSVPAFVAAARLSVDRKDYDAALAQVNVALDFDPGYAKGRLLKAQLLVGRGELAEANRELEKYVQLEPGDMDAARLRELCAPAPTLRVGEERLDDQVRLAEIAEVLMRQGLSPLAEGLAQNRRQLAGLYSKRIAAAWPGAKLDVRPDGSLSVSGLPTDLTDLRPLAGIPLNSLDLGSRPVMDLAPLHGMPLTRLNLDHCSQIKELSPLAGMKLTWLNLAWCGLVHDLEPLRGMPLTLLYLHGCEKIKDFSPLAGMPLAELVLHSCAVKDLEVLRGTPLAVLSLVECRQIKNLSPLAGMKLADLFLTKSQVSDLRPLAGMPLKKLDLRFCPIKDLSPLAGMSLTELNADDCTSLKNIEPLSDMPLTVLTLRRTRVSDLTPLGGMPLRTLYLSGCEQLQDIRPLAGLPLTLLGLWGCEQLQDLSPLAGLPLETLFLNSCKRVRDFTPLKNLPLTSLDASRTEFEDLTILSGMKLTTLWLQGCRQVRDLRPLAGMPLTELNLDGTSVVDLTPLAGMPLKILWVAGCEMLEDLRPLAELGLLRDLSIHDCPRVKNLAPLRSLRLEHLDFRPQFITEGMDAIRAMKTLKSITATAGPPIPAAEFWQRYDAGEFRK